MALAAQGLDGSATGKSISATLDRLGLLQIDSVNVIARSHYLPLFSRIGIYPQIDLENKTWGTTPDLFEYWRHEASLLPLKIQPLLRWRMEDVRSGAPGWVRTAAYLRDNKKLVDAALSEFTHRGPMTASEFSGSKSKGGWWGWSDAKRLCESLFAGGVLGVRTRRNNFERVYGLAETILPPDIQALPTPARDEAQRALIMIAMHAQGTATESDLRDYFRMNRADVRARITELVENKQLEPVIVEGWAVPAYRDPFAKCPRRINHAALLSPFDNAIWHRERTERLFNTRVRLEIYTPAQKRIHGYYVLPFMQDGAITARVDLKADRKKNILLVHASHGEPESNGDTPARLAAELKRMAGWLGLSEIKVARKGSLHKALRGQI